jgi:4-diphosphocytidyl-2-C-methyl-D-erythritol kinase
VSPSETLSVFSPAKLNLFLAITGRRPDGFHELVSVAAPLDFGDELKVTIADHQPAPAERFRLSCDDPRLPVDGTNLVLKAAEAFAAATSWKGSAEFHLRKRIPVGAGLGGGSSNATAALLALNRLTGAGLDRARLSEVAAAVGSDCPLFLAGGPVLVRGRGERVEMLGESAARRLRGRRVLVFKPSIEVSTAWAYAQMAAAAPGSYWPIEEVTARVQAWLAGSAPAEDLLANNMEPAVFRKFIALPVLLEQLRTRFGVQPRMSGSGSACFMLLPDGAPVSAITAAIKAAWGTPSFVQLAVVA